MKVNYYDWFLKNYINFGIEVLCCNQNEARIRCLTCGAEKTILLKSIYKSVKAKGEWNGHNSFCSTYYRKLIASEIGEDKGYQFAQYYRYSKERWCNPNSKDYERYKGKFGFNDYTHYSLSCFPKYKEALKIYGTDTKLSIDRIDSDKKYEPGNIRFVPMDVNLRNKKVVKEIIAYNLETKETFEGESAAILSQKIFGNTSKVSSILRHANGERISPFLGKWIFKFKE